MIGALAGAGRQIDGTDLSELVLVPITAASANLVKTPFPQNVHYVAAQGRPNVALADAIADIEDMLRNRHRIRLNDPDDFRVQNLSTFAETANKISSGVAMLLGLRPPRLTGRFPVKRNAADPYPALARLRPLGGAAVSSGSGSGSCADAGSAECRAITAFGSSSSFDITVSISTSSQPCAVR